MSSNTQLHGTFFTHSSSGTATAMALTLRGTGTYYVTDINGTSAGTAGTWTILGGATGTTVFWQGSGAVSQMFAEPLKTTTGTISFNMSGTVATYANMGGYVI